MERVLDILDGRGSQKAHTGHSTAWWQGLDWSPLDLVGWFVSVYQELQERDALVSSSSDLKCLFGSLLLMSPVQSDAAQGSREIAENQMKAIAFQWQQLKPGLWWEGRPSLKCEAEYKD